MMYAPMLMGHGIGCKEKREAGLTLAELCRRIRCSGHGAARLHLRCLQSYPWCGLQSLEGNAVQFVSLTCG